MLQRSATWLGGAALIASALGGNVHAENKQQIGQMLKEFQSDPKAFINDHKNVAKFDPDTGMPVETPTFFSKESILSRDFILEKDVVQNSSKNKQRNGRAPYYANDLAENLVDELRIRNLQEMDASNLTKGNAAVQPWSDDYWPIFKGVIGRRYNDPNFPNTMDWATNVNYVAADAACSVNQLSPAEKYDLLVGDPNRTLTRRMLNEGVQYARTGKVETWMGICHGWAPAATMLSRPSHQVTVMAADGITPITFYPTDIKALSSLLWANAAPPSRFISGRCNVKHPAEDANGRILNQECFDTNPGTWHLAVVNQLGVARRSFVLDATYDYEVWNQPAYAYSYSYFNPQTFTVANSLQEATVSSQDYYNDKFRPYRSRNAAYYVGVAMQFVYIAETNPTAKSKDSPAHDKRVAVNYLYDLELDSHFNIIGGEWYNRQHPDFLWTPAPGARAVSVGDNYLNRPEFAGMPSWNGSNSVPQHWRQAAVGASQRGQPLAGIVETLGALASM